LLSFLGPDNPSSDLREIVYLDSLSIDHEIEGVWAETKDGNSVSVRNDHFQVDNPHIEDFAEDPWK